ncbi:MAG: ABC transporter ATP-binding protein/permease [Negativicutes bacterium]|nr:ABC transporter ATP-binding protein/permease [Negativicutes bacterium]
MQNFRKIVTLIRPYRLLYTAVILALIVGNLMKLVPPMILRSIIDQGIPSGNMQLVVHSLWLYIGLWVLRGICNFIQWYGSENVGQRIALDLRQSLHDKLQTLSISWFAKTQTGSILAKLTEDVDIVQQFVCWSFLELITNVISVLGTVTMLVYISPTLAAKALATLPVLFFLVYRFNRVVRPAWEAVREQMDHLTSALQENISGVRVVKAFARENFEMGKFDRQNMIYRDKNISRARLEARYNPMMEFTSALGIMLFLFFGGLEYQAGRISMGDLLSFNMYLWEFMWPVRMLGFLINMLGRALAAAPRVFAILDLPAKIHDPEHPIAPEVIRGHLCFENVSFHFEDDPQTEILSRINLDVQPGERVAIVGGTGSGKTTMMNLIPRFHDVTEGRITLDGVDLRDFSLATLRQNIGMVLQETFLFSTSIGDNIAYGSPNATVAAVKHAAEVSQAAEFIDTLPQGYHTMVGERGIGLSGGQKQRVALARAVLLNPKILILDEATSSVDVETEQKIQSALETVMAGRTTLIIAKRLSTIQNADRVVILEGGRIAEMGTHQELLSLGGLYRRLFEQQMSNRSETQQKGV